MAVALTHLPLQQLEALRSQVDHDLEFLATSMQQLKVAQSKFVESKETLNKLSKNNAGKELLLPLTSSMYVPGHLNDVERVMVDIGTGYFVEKNVEEAKEFFQRKIDFLAKQTDRIEPLLQDKCTLKQAVNETFNTRVQQQRQAMQQQSSASKA